MATSGGHMTHIFKSALCTGAALSALIASTAEANEQNDLNTDTYTVEEKLPEADKSPLSDITGEITVTARRRVERLSDVPISITAFSERDIRRQDVRTVSDLERSIPGLSVCCGRGQATSPFLRGVPGVLGYFSEVPVALDGRQNFFDMASVQALKGRREHCSG